VTVQDLLFRNALCRSELIDDPLSDEPWKWRCWVTDFIKRPKQTKAWSKSTASERQLVIRDGARLLEQELEILSEEPNAVKLVVCVGKDSQRYYESHLGGRKQGFKTEWIYHYAWPKSVEQERMFFERCEKVIGRNSSRQVKGS